MKGFKKVIKLLALLFVTALLCYFMAGCGAKEDGDTQQESTQTSQPAKEETEIPERHVEPFDIWAQFTASGWM